MTPAAPEQVAYQFSLVPGYFQQDEARGRNNQKLGTVFDFPRNFGLISQSYDTDDSLDPNLRQPTDWQRFHHKLHVLNEQGRQHDTQYILLYAARHGQGFHNIGEEKVGTQVWQNPSPISQIPFRLLPQFRDASLTPVGEDQATTVSSIFSHLIRSQHLPAPTAFYCSPLRRACQTAELTWKPLCTPKPANGDNITPWATTSTTPTPAFTSPSPLLTTLIPHSFAPKILNHLREQMYNANCNQRSSPSQITQSFPEFSIDETDLTSSPHPDSDPILESYTDAEWSPESNEPDYNVTIRAYKALTYVVSSLDLFPRPPPPPPSSPSLPSSPIPPSQGIKAHAISLTAHAGFLSALYRVLSDEYRDHPAAIPRLSTGIVVPLLVQVARLSGLPLTVSSSSSSVPVTPRPTTTTRTTNRVVEFVPNIPRIRPMATSLVGKDRDGILAEIFNVDSYVAVRREMEAGKWS